MQNPDPFLTQEWPWSIHIEVRRKYVSEDTAKVLKDIMEGKPYKMKAEDYSDADLKKIAEYIILSHTEDIEFLSIAEMTDDQLDFDWEDDSTVDEREKIWRRVDKLISKATVTVTFDKD